MFSIVLYQPQIPPNTGNIIRLCANTGASLHLIEPLGFCLDDKSCRRAGLDYHSLTSLSIWSSFSQYHKMHHKASQNIWAITKFGTVNYADAQFTPGDSLLFGSETTGLPATIHTLVGAQNRLYIPMHAGSRSLNLANSVAILLFEAWRQQQFR